MKHALCGMSVWLLLSGVATAQESTEPAAEATAAEPAAESPAEPKPGPYSKKVKGWLWLELVAGPTAYDPDRFRGFDLGGFLPSAPKSRGPQWGFSLGTGFGGGFFLGWYYRQGHYTGYKLMRTGLEMQPTIRLPYIHIMFRIDLGFARIFGGNPWGLSGFNNGGFDSTFGVGLRIPVVRWISVAINFDWSYIGLSVRGDTAAGRQTAWTSGQVLAGTFALTFHFIGVRKD